MPLNSSVEVVEGRGGDRASLTDGFEDISGGVTAYLGTEKGSASSATLFIETKGAVELTTEFSPDGDTWREPRNESPVAFDVANEDLVYMDYDAAYLRVTASNTTGVDLDLRVTA